jgi:hypothetical protein
MPSSKQCYTCSNGGVNYKNLLGIAKRVSNTHDGNTRNMAVADEHAPTVQTLSSLKAKNYSAGSQNTPLKTYCNLCGMP